MHEYLRKRICEIEVLIQINLRSLEYSIFGCISVWDQARLSRYNFVWWDVTSLQPYTGETQFENSLLVQRSGGLALSSLSNVFHSLTTNARSIFIIMVRHQLRNQKDPTYLGTKHATRSQQLDYRWV
jgi:hypothetical protein